MDNVGCVGDPSQQVYQGSLWQKQKNGSVGKHTQGPEELRTMHGRHASIHPFVEIISMEQPEHSVRS